MREKISETKSKELLEVINSFQGVGSAFVPLRAIDILSTNPTFIPKVRSFGLWIKRAELDKSPECKLEVVRFDPGDLPLGVPFNTDRYGLNISGDIIYREKSPYKDFEEHRLPAMPEWTGGIWAVAISGCVSIGSFSTTSTTFVSMNFSC